MVVTIVQIIPQNVCKSLNLKILSPQKMSTDSSKNYTLLTTVYSIANNNIPEIKCCEGLC